MPHKILSPAVPGRPRTPPPSVGADSISARGPPRRRKVCGTMQASSPTEVCHNAWPQPSRSAQNIKFIRRGGIYPAREPRAAIGTPGFAPRLKYTPNRPPCQRGLAAGKARRLGDCPATTAAPGGPTKTRPLPSTAFQGETIPPSSLRSATSLDKGG